MSAPRVIVVIPAYNEEKHIADVIKRTRNSGWPVVVIDDGSGDSTARLAEAAGATVVRHETNKGKGQAILTAVEWVLASSFEAAVFLDADGQHAPEEVGRFVTEYEICGADLIIGTRMSDIASMPIVRRMSNRLSSLMISIVSGQRITDSQSGFRMMSRRMLEYLRETGGGSGFEFESEMIINAVRDGIKYSEVPISCIYGDEKSHYAPVRDAARFARVMAHQTIKRLRNRP